MTGVKSQPTALSQWAVECLNPQTATERPSFSHKKKNNIYYH